MTKANASGGVSMSQDELFEFVKSLKAEKAAQDAEIAALKAALKAEKPQVRETEVSCKVSDKGSLVVSLGWGKTNQKWFYIQQADLVFSDKSVKKIRAFIDANRSKFSTRNDG